MKKPIIIATVLCVVASACQAQTVKRGRNEGTTNIPASNVIGNGNITVFTSAAATYDMQKAGADPQIGCVIGISEFMQLTGHVAFPDFHQLGVTGAHLQITTPGNDRLRLIGVSGTADLYLSTEMDTLSGTAASGKPEYNAYLRGALTVDLDLIARFKTFPMKIYFYGGITDNPQLLYLYDQISARTGVEWKMYEHSFSVDAGVGMYKEKRHNLFPGDQSYVQRTGWIEPGGRYRLWGRYSVTGSLRCLLFQDLKRRNPLPTTLFRISAGIEAPLIFKETNTEAIRTLVFMEQKKEKKKDIFTNNMEQGKSMRTDFEATFEGTEDSEVRTEREKDNIDKREEIQKKMDEIERMLEDLQ